MKTISSKALLSLAIINTIICLIQIILLARYLDRLPDDTLGLVLGLAAIIAFAFVACYTFVQWLKSRNR
jgi:hypothetical protein